MPELPELEVVCEVLNRRVVNQAVTAVEVIPPGGGIVVRDLTNQGLEASLGGRLCTAAARRGKFLLLSFVGPGNSELLQLVINPKLTGRLQLAGVAEKRMAKTHLVFTLQSGAELRYVDQKTMGQVYLTWAPDAVPGFAELGPEPLTISFEEFRQRLRPLRGEIKGVLVRGDCVAGIGNAYADEILWSARLNPFRKRTQLSEEETHRLYTAMQATLRTAIDQVRTEMGEAIHRKPREFLAVHMKTGEPCPRCGSPIALVGANQRITNFCRTCQPGGLFKDM